ncbi:MAG: hypothetical protein IPO36_00005 [Anaerolineales bacterium]|nr:hypothetical protein [Anaerolineales bacterium]
MSVRDDPTPINGRSSRAIRGFAIYVKFVAAFFIIGGGLGAAPRRVSFETARRPQVYVMTVLGILPGAAYVITVCGSRAIVSIRRSLHPTLF